MNQINCKAIGTERLFARFSDSFSRLDDFSEEELTESLAGLMPFTKLRLAYYMHSGLRTAAESIPAGDPLMPDSVRALCSKNIFALARQENMEIFFKWLRNIHISNEQGRNEWTLSLKTVASRLGGAESSFLQAFFALSNQRVFITRNGGRITLSAAEREWGRVSVRFDDCECAELPGLPLPGYAVATEAEVLADGRLSFSILVDTYFKSETDFIGRLLSDEGWQRITFTCSDIAVEMTCVDYVRRMEECGTPKADMVENACRILINKNMLIGRDALNPEERMLMPAAVLTGVRESVNDGDISDWQGEDMIFDALENRYAVSRFITQLKEADCAEMAKCIEQAAQAYDNGQEKEALRFAKLFAAFFNACVADGSGRPLLHSMCRGFSRASALNTGLTTRARAETAALECVRKSVSPVMEKLGFSGSFPNFRRKSDERLEYISFILDLKSDRVNKGVISFSASVAAAETSAERLEGCKNAAFSCEDATALDCLAEAFGPSHYAELCGSEDDSGADIDIDLYSGSLSVRKDSSDMLKEYIDYAESQFSSGAIPLSYRRMRRSFPGKKTAFPRAMLRSLPAAVVVMIVLLGAYLLFAGEEPAFGRETALAAALAAGLAVDILLSVIHCVACSFRLWRY